MRSFISIMVLALGAGTAGAQQPAPTGAAPASASGVRPLPPDSVGVSPAAECARPAADSLTAALALRPADSLCVTRSQAITLALRFNPQLGVADAQTAQA